MLRAYISALYELAQRDSRVISIQADNGTDYDWMFQRDFPDRFFNVGIAEQNMVALGAGLASKGFIPFVSTAGAFLTYRAGEFIRDDVCFGRRNVKMMASGSGLSISNLGPTHHTTEDLAFLRALPNLTILSPTTPSEVGAAVAEAYRIDGPVYLRLGMNGEPELGEPCGSADPYHARCLKGGEQTAIFVTGSIAAEALEAAQMLDTFGISTGVYSFAALSPLDRDTIFRIASSVRLVVTLEEHSVIGGLGSAVAECLSELPAHAPVCRMGLMGFAKGYGTLAQMRRTNHLDGLSVAERIKKQWEALL